MTQESVRKILSQNIKKIRKELGLTQAKLAELADISEPYMNDIERCQTWVSDKTLAKLSWALKVEIHELFMQDDTATDIFSNKKETYLLFQKHKQEMHDYIEKSFEILQRDILN